MTVFCDTNVLIAASVESHAHHEAARKVLERIHAGIDEGFVAAHSLAEAYSVLTRLPGTNQLEPLLAWQLISENVLQAFSVISLNAKEYTQTLQGAAKAGVSGGKVYDYLLLAAAAKCNPERILTFNVPHFVSLAPISTQVLITSP